MRVVVDFDACESHGVCAELAPAVFRVGEDLALHLLEETPGEDQWQAVKEAERLCPTGAIFIIEDP